MLWPTTRFVVISVPSLLGVIHSRVIEELLLLEEFPHADSQHPEVLDGTCFHPETILPTQRCIIESLQLVYEF